jgi:alpha-ketoglutarate-dependent taurine dioxygenase
MQTELDPQADPQPFFDEQALSEAPALGSRHSAAVRSRPFDRGGPLPLLVEPAAPGADLTAWSLANRELVSEWLLRHGAILFRGFAITAPEPFEAFAGSVCRELFNENGEHPRAAVSGNVYTPVFYPPESHLLWHNENSFNRRWPTKILFCCARPAAGGGETPLVDSRAVYRRIDPQVRERFESRGLLYLRHYGAGAGLDWQTVFGTADQAEVEARCATDGFEAAWKDGGRVLRTRCRRPAVVRHPVSGELSWFNQAQHWHIACLDPETREDLLAVFGEENLPRQCCYGDGSPIAGADMEHILAVYRELEVCFPWQTGDVVLVDNVLAAHARNPFQGERKILVALGDMASYDDV